MKGKLIPWCSGSLVPNAMWQNCRIQLSVVWATMLAHSALLGLILLVLGIERLDEGCTVAGSMGYAHKRLWNVASAVEMVGFGPRGGGP